MLTLARHVGSDPIMICILVRHAIEAITIELLAPYLPELKVFFPEIKSAYEAPPAGAAFPRTFLTEKKYLIEWLIKELREAEQRKNGAWRDVWKSVLAGEEGRHAVEHVDTFERAIKLTEDLLPVYDRMAEVVALPREEFDRRYPGFIQEARAANPLAGILLPAIDKVLATEHRSKAKMAMLKAAMAVVQGGQEELKDIKDPFGDGPFEYRALDEGFELKTKLIYNDQPVTLTVGRGKKG
jgi:hypothetical protein